jgi:hypothetical protein
MRHCGRNAIAAAAAGLKCTKFGGSTGAPRRPEVEALLSAHFLLHPLKRGGAVLRSLQIQVIAFYSAMGSKP